MRDSDPEISVSLASNGPISPSFSIPRRAVPIIGTIPEPPSSSSASPCLQSTPTPSQASKAKIDEEALNNSRLYQKIWRSRSLERRTLLGFAGLFVALFIAIEAIIEVSRNNQGIAYADENAYYLWTYGPVAVLTLTLAFWSRIEYRAKQLAPYILVHKNLASADKAIGLDYVSSVAPKTIYAATRQRHTLVALASISSLLVTLLIVVSTGLLGLEDFQVPKTGVSMTTSDSFMNQIPALSGVSMQMPFYIYDAIHNLSLKYPPGTTASFAYQSFNLTKPSVAETISAEVDGFSANLACEPAALHFGGLSRSLDSGQAYGHGTPFIVVSNVSISTNACEANVTPPTQGEKVGDKYTFGRFLKVECNGARGDEDSQRIAIYTMELVINSSAVDDYSATYDFGVLRSTQLLCTPSYSLPRLRVTIDRISGVNTAATIVDSSPTMGNRTLGINAWNLMNSILDSMSSLFNYDGNPLWDPEFELARQARPDLTDNDMFEISNLQEMFTSFYSSVAAQIAKEFFMSSSQSATVGTSVTARTRLVVRSLSARIMEATLAVLAVMAIIMATFCPRQHAIPCDPGSIVGSATVFSSNEQLIELSGHSSTPEKARSAHGTWCPSVLQPLFRTIGLCFIAAVVVILESLLQVSQKHSGIMNVNSNRHTHYAWAYLPALVMVMIKLFALALDFNTKLLAPFSRLKQEGTYENALNINYVKQLAPAAIISSIRARQLAVTATTLMALVGGLLTIVVSGVYDSEQRPTQSSIEIQALDSFRSIENLILDITPDDKGALLGALILEEGLSYPQWTYDELVFPKLEIIDDSGDNIHGSYIDTIVPALRANLQCRYLSGLHQVNASVNWTSGDLTIAGPPGIYIGVTRTVSPDSVFGISDWVANGNGIGDPPEYSYFWGSLKGREIENVVILMCDEDIQSINVSARFSLPDFFVDEGSQPSLIENSAKWFSNLFLLEPYSELPINRNSTFPLDQFFSLLLEGKGGIQLTDLRDPTRIDKIVETIKHFHCILRAQEYNIILRQPPPQNETVTSRRYPSTMTSNNRSRLIQHAVSTRILEGMLLAMLVLGIAATFMMKTRNVLLENPCSIAAMGRLLADSSLLDHQCGCISINSLPSGVSDKATLFEGQLFKLGWFARKQQSLVEEQAQAGLCLEHTTATDSEKDTRVFTIRTVNPIELQTGLNRRSFEEAGKPTAISGAYDPITLEDFDPNLHFDDMTQESNTVVALSTTASTDRRLSEEHAVPSVKPDNHIPEESESLVRSQDQE